MTVTLTQLLEQLRYLKDRDLNSEMADGGYYVSGRKAARMRKIKAIEKQIGELKIGSSWA